jgi:hypothetical protein
MISRAKGPGKRNNRGSKILIPLIEEQKAQFQAQFTRTSNRLVDLDGNMKDIYGFSEIFSLSVLRNRSCSQGCLEF